MARGRGRLAAGSDSDSTSGSETGGEDYGDASSVEDPSILEKMAFSFVFIMYSRQPLPKFVKKWQKIFNFGMRLTERKCFSISGPDLFDQLM